MESRKLDLVGVAEIAAAYDVSKATTWRWTKRADFPEPVARLASGPIWRRSDVDKWASSFPPRVGPRKKRGAGRAGD